MCEECGCGEIAAGTDTHVHDHEYAHKHGIPHSHEGHAGSHAHGDAREGKRLVRLERKILSHNDEIAARNRAWLAERGVTAVNIISSPGAGKTLLLEKTLEALRGRAQCAVITGDQQTDNDARRLEGKGAPVRQIETISACHLDAERVGALLPEVVTDGVRLLFIENVGNLVCPAAFDLGENFKVALLSSTEGEDKPLKYPTLFSLAPVVVLTKIDLAPHLDWDLRQCRKNLQSIRPGVYVFELSAKTGEGMAEWLEYLVKLTN